MQTYVILTKLTAEGRKTIQENPGRIQEVDKEIEKMGIRIKSQYALLGPYDFINIVEAPDNIAISKAAVGLGARGTIETLTLPAITLGDFI